MRNNSRSWGCRSFPLAFRARRTPRQRETPSKEPAMSDKTWGGRFSGDTDNRAIAFTESISYDRRLYRHDIRASQAHARMLAEVGLLSADAAEQIVKTLDQIGDEIERGELSFSVKLEDIHTHIERA